MKTNLFRSCLLVLLALVGLSTTSAQTYELHAGDKVSSEEGVFIVKGSNLITNPTFDDGFAGWMGADGNELSDNNFEVPTSGGADGGAYLKALSGAGSSSAKSIRTGWPITPGKRYVLSFWAYRPSVDGNAQYSQIHLGSTDTDTNHEIGRVQYTGGAWSQTQLIFESGDYSYVIAKFSWLTSNAGFDCFNLWEVEASDELVLTNLEAEIAKAEELLSSTEEGDARGQYTTAVRQALESAIADARGVLAGATSQTQINEATAALKSAEKTYSNSVNPPFVPGKQYNIVHSSGYYLTTNGDGGTVKITESDVNDKNQIFTFTLAPEGSAASGYNLQDANGVYVYRSGSWDTKASSSQDITVANAIFQVVDYDSYVQLKNLGSGSVLGTDNNSNNSTVYSNKNGTDGKYRWTLVEYVPADQRDAEYNYNELLGKAQKQYADVNVSNVGSGLFQVSKTAYEAFGAAIAESQTMTDFQAALDYLQAAMDAFAANKVNQPNPEADYIITQSSGNPIGYDESQSLVVLGAKTEPFRIIAGTGGVFYLRHVPTGKYVAKSANSNWDTTWEDTEGSATAQWIISPYDATYYTIQNNSGKGYLGSDNTSAGSPLYCDKAASAANSHWTIVENSVSGIVDATLQSARDLLSETEVGTEYWQVPQSAADALQQAITKAESDKATATVETAADIVTALQEAMIAFKSSFNPLSAFDTDLTYYIVHSGGNVLTATTSGNATITTLGAENKPTEAQRMNLESTDGGRTYMIKSVANETYLSVSGDYNTQWLSTPDATSTFQIVQLSGKYLGLKNVSKGTYFGTDATASGQLVYSDKSATQNSYWLIQTYQDLDRTLFQAALDKVQQYADSMKEGYQVGEYFADVIAEYAQVIADAQAQAKKAASQEALDQMAADLEATIAAYKSRANTTNRASEYLAIQIAAAKSEVEAAVIGVDKGQYTQPVVDAYNQAIQSAEKASNAEAAIQALAQAREAFLAGANQVDRAALTAAIAAAEKTAATLVAGDCNGQYSQEAIDAYNQAVADAKAVYGDITKTQAEVDAATSDLKSAATDLADAKVVVDYSALKDDVTSTQKLIDQCAKLIGEGPGTYPQDAYDALKSALATAKAVLDNKSVSQKTVDEASEALQQAIAEFEDTWRDIDKTELSALLDALRALLARTDITLSSEDQEILAYDIEMGEAAMKSGEQAVIDRVVKIMTRDYAYLSDVVTAIDRILSGDLTDAFIYDLQGRRQSRLQPGVNILRIAGKTYKIFR